MLFRGVSDDGISSCLFILNHQQHSRKIQVKQKKEEGCSREIKKEWKERKKEKEAKEKLKSPLTIRKGGNDFQLRQKVQTPTKRTALETCCQTVNLDRND
jgi:hypothetical protein